MWTYNYSNELYHHGIKGQRWGVRRFQNKDGSLTSAGKKRMGYSSTSLGSAIAKRQNAKVDKGFDDWKENDAKKKAAIDAGKKATKAKRDYEANKSDKSLKSEYKSANKEYKKALKSNTTYRKGAVKSEVGKDAARKYLSDAKKIEKQLKADPNNKQLKKQYNSLMSLHDKERAKARRAAEVGAKRSQKKASIKRTMTNTAKAAATTAAVSAGALAINHILNKYDVRIDGKSVGVNKNNIADVMKYAKKGKDLFGYVY